MECKLLNEYNGIAVGDIVKMIQYGQVYSGSGKPWLEYYGLDKTKWRGYDSNSVKIIRNNIVGKVLAIGKHLDDGSKYVDDMLFYVDFGEESCVVSIEGLGLVSKANKNHCIIINKIEHFYIVE